MAKYYASKTNEVSKRELEHMNLVRGLAGECMVVLENDGTLPLKQASKNLALYGNGARHTVKGGTGSGDVNSRKVVSIEEGLEDAGFTITTKSWLASYDQVLKEAKEAYRNRLAKIAKEQGKPEIVVYFENPFQEPTIPEISKEDVSVSDTNTAIYVISRNSGEGADRYNKEGDYQLTKEEINAITFLGQEYEKVVVILNVANVIDTTILKEIPGVNAILLAGQAGNIGGFALADVLLGKSIPSGKLTDTWAKNYDDYASSKTFSHNNGNLDDEYYTDGIYVGYRYFDSFNITPNYCFGYGKSYTTFSIETQDVIANEDKVSVTVKVTNVGKEYPGKEVVQVYYSAPEGSLEKPYQELVAFGKTDLLMPGASQIMNISYNTKSMASYSQEKAAWIIEKGDYVIRVGNSSRNTRIEAVITLSEDVVTEQLKTLFPDTEPLTEISRKGVPPFSYETEKAEKEAAKKIVLDDSKFITETVAYKEEIEEFPIYEGEKLTIADVKAGKATLKDLVSQLTVEEMAVLCNGTARSGIGSKSVIGAASAQAPGAAGDTTSLLIEDRQIRNIIMADGPAGLRLYPHFAVDKNGDLVPGGEVFGDAPIAEIKKPEGSTDYYQYCTAIPVATTLAQSWDMDLIEKAGDIVGREMEELHVTLWLAPGMNIHRNPLCGRNFEYYSEDPLLSGMCAAADTKGVQSHKGIGTTIKHYAANNQEDNRMFTNAHITERTLREIYLKGFEIAVKTSQPMTIMSSYNLLNGTHTANHYNLLTAVARDEWNFAGFIMTDWGASDDISFVFGGGSKYTNSSPIECIKAGNDLQMPGNQKNVDAIVKAVKDNTLKKAELQLCAYHILKIIEASQAYDDCKPYTELFGNLPDVVSVENIYINIVKSIVLYNKLE